MTRNSKRNSAIAQKESATMKTTTFVARMFSAAACATALGAHAFTSGSTGADGPLSPTVNTVVTVPASGVLNYSTINIPSGVTVTFAKNAVNTPVVLLVSSDATIAGTLSVSAAAGKDAGAAGDGNAGDDGIPGTGGPGGYDGGRGGRVAADRNGGSGLGPGGGVFGSVDSLGDCVGGGGGGYSARGSNAGWVGVRGLTVQGQGGATYGSSNLLPLVGGSGGGGGCGGAAFPGTGGGGGGGALLIAASGTVSITGSILANGGQGGNTAGQGSGATGGGGSGGAIRIIATTISGNGTVSAAKGNNGGSSVQSLDNGGAGSDGRIRFEAETFTRTASSTPAHSFGAPGTVFIAGSPTLKIKTVGGQTVPAAPTGTADLQFPATVANPVAVTFETTSVPVGNTVKLTLTPAFGPPSSAVSDALVGSTSLATASASLTLPQGASTLQATLTYTLTASLGDAMSRFAQGERVDKVRLSASPGVPSSSVTLITVSGREFEVPAALLALGG